MSMGSHFRVAVRMIVVMTVLTGVIYPLAVTGVGQLLFRERAGGSLIERDGVIVGSELVGQTFTAPRYFWSRPSAVSYDGGGSAGSNLGPTNAALRTRVAATVSSLREASPGAGGNIPVELATASGSGLDPHLSPAAALYQVSRVATARGVSEEVVRRLVEAHIEPRQLGFLGEPRVNVLRLNLALDEVAPGHRQRPG